MKDWEMKNKKNLKLKKENRFYTIHGKVYKGQANLNPPLRTFLTSPN